MFLQLLFNSIVSGLLLSLVAIGFNLIFSVTKVFHLAHGISYIAGAYVFVFLDKYFAYSNSVFILSSVLLSVIVVAVMVYTIEKLVYQPLVKRNAGQAITLISSLGVYLFFVNLIALLYANENKFISTDIGNSIVWNQLIIVPVQFIQLGASIIFIVALLLFTKTKAFLKIRAVTSQETVASVLGINTKRIRLLVMICGSILAAVAGILKFYDTGINPYAGMSITLSAAVAVIISGNISIAGTIAASLLIAFLQTVTEWFLSAQWKEGMTFLLLICVILWKTEGIVSFKMRVEER